MAVTNKEIIVSEMIAHGITETVNTYDGWKRSGYQVQRGQKALFITSIWKPCKVKVKKGNTEETTKKLYMVKAAFFGFSQVAIIKTEDL